jgi:hypothetical protein
MRYYICFYHIVRRTYDFNILGTRMETSILFLEPGYHKLLTGLLKVLEFLDKVCFAINLNNYVNSQRVNPTLRPYSIIVHPAAISHQKSWIASPSTRAPHRHVHPALPHHFLHSREVILNP